MLFDGHISLQWNYENLQGKKMETGGRNTPTKIQSTFPDLNIE